MTFLRTLNETIQCFYSWSQTRIKSRSSHLSMKGFVIRLKYFRSSLKSVFSSRLALHYFNNKSYNVRYLRAISDWVWKTNTEVIKKADQNKKRGLQKKNHANFLNHWKTRKIKLCIWLVEKLVSLHDQSQSSIEVNTKTVPDVNPEKYSIANCSH